MSPAQQAAHQATRIPSSVLACGLVAFAAGTYAYVLQKIGPNLEDQLEAEAARQEALERRAQQQPSE